MFDVDVDSTRLDLTALFRIFSYPALLQINEHDMVVSLPSSLTGVVRRKEVSDYFFQKAANSNSKHSRRGSGSGGRGRYFEEANTAEAKPLTDLFTEGQVRSYLILYLSMSALDVTEPMGCNVLHLWYSIETSI